MTEPISIPGKVIAFDYGEVVSQEPSSEDRAAIVALAGAGSDPARFWNTYWLHRVALDQGAITPSEYWCRIEQDLDANWEPSRHHQLGLHDFRSWLTIDPGTLDVLIDLRRGNTRMAMLSNAGCDFASYYRHGMLGDFFDVVLVSGEIGHLKLGRTIYERLLTLLATAPKDVVFIDNRAENVAVAERLGITSHQYSGHVGLRQFLGKLAGT